MTIEIYEKSFISLKRHMAEYLPYLERAIAAIKVLETTDADSAEYSKLRLLSDYCTDRLLLRWAGGRYRFIRKLLQDHFAAMRLERE